MAIYEQRLQRDLDRIREEVSHLGESVEEAVRNGLTALFSGNAELANLTVLRDQGINRQCRKVNRLCHNFIARHLPSAGHLRMIASVLRLVNELERVGDYGVTISREFLHLKAAPSDVLRRDLEVMAGHARAMLSQSLTSFNEENAERARGTMAMADQVGRELDMAYADLVEQGSKGAVDIRQMLDLHAIFYTLERISDRSKNICEETLFVVAGETKAEEVFTILFIDQVNSVQSQMAEAIAKKGFPNAGIFRSAGQKPAADLEPAMVEFMRRNGLDLQGMHPQGLDAFTPNINEVDVVISLEGPVSGYSLELPFHTAFLEWEVGKPPAANADQKAVQSQYEAMYREISLKVGDLMELLRGEEV